MQKGQGTKRVGQGEMERATKELKITNQVYVDEEPFWSRLEHRPDADNPEHWCSKDPILLPDVPEPEQNREDTIERGVMRGRETG